MSRILQLGLLSNWSLQYTNSFSATSVLTDGKGNPIFDSITEIIGSTIFDKPIIAINVTTTVPVGKIWKYAGRCTRIINTGFGEAYNGERKSLYLGKFNVINFQDLDADYKINVLPPTWFRDLNLSIYQYEGTDSTTFEADISSEIQQIITKVGA